MKRLLFAALLMCSAVASNAQIPAQIAYVRALNAGQYSCGTPGCITRAIEGHMHDTTLSIMNQIYALISASGDLASVCAIGNTTPTTIASTDGTNSGIIDNTEFYTQTSGILTAKIGLVGGVGSEVLKDGGSAFTFRTQAGPQTGNHAAIWPDEGTGSGLASKVMLHTSKNLITITDGTAVGIYDKNFMQASSGTGNTFSASGSGYQLLNTLGLGISQYMQGLGNSFNYNYNDGISTIFNQHLYFPKITSGDPIASYTDSFPRRNGILQIAGDQVNPTYTLGSGAGTGATLSFSTTSDDPSGTISVTYGTTPASGGIIATIIFHQKHQNPVRVLIGGGDETGQIDCNSSHIWARGGTDPTRFDIISIGVHPAGTYLYTYIVQY